MDHSTAAYSLELEGGPMQRMATVLAALCLFVAVGCGDDDDASAPPLSTSSTAPTSTSASAAPDPTGVVITTSDSEFGPMLFDSTGQAIYLFEIEETSEPECYGPCAGAWPPVLTDGAPQAAGQIDASLLGTVRRTDGTTQVTYKGHPLYFYVNEGKNEVECHDVYSFGGLWFVVMPNGDAAPA